MYLTHRDVKKNSICLKFHGDEGFKRKEKIREKSDGMSVWSFKLSREKKKGKCEGDKEKEGNNATPTKKISVFLWIGKTWKW